MASDAKLDRLHAVPLFAGCKKKELKELASAIDTVDVAAGRQLIRQGSVVHEAYIIESGTAEVTIEGELVAEIPEGEMIGEIGLLTRVPATATVTAKTPMALLLISNQRFNHILENTPGLSLAIAKELAGRLQAMDARLH